MFAVCHHAAYEQAQRQTRQTKHRTMWVRPNVTTANRGGEAVSHPMHPASHTIRKYSILPAYFLVFLKRIHAKVILLYKIAILHVFYGDFVASFRVGLCKPDGSTHRCSPTVTLMGLLQPMRVVEDADPYIKNPSPLGDTTLFHSSLFTAPIGASPLCCHGHHRLAVNPHQQQRNKNKTDALCHGERPPDQSNFAC